MKKHNNSGLLLAILLVVIYFGCDDFEDEAFNKTALESKAVDLMQDTMYIDLNLPLIDDYNASWIDNETIFSMTGVIIDSLISNSFLVIPQDSCYRISLDVDIDTSYVALSISESDYVALFFNESLDVDLFSETGNMITADEKLLGMDLIATGIGYEYDNTGLRTLKYFLKTRRYYNIVEGRYLLRLIVTDQTELTTFRHVIQSGD